MSPMTAASTNVIDPAALVPAALSRGLFRDRPGSVLGFARSGIALARFLADAGALVTVYDARPEHGLARAIAGLDGRPVRLLLGPDVDPAAAADPGRIDQRDVAALMHQVGIDCVARRTRLVRHDRALASDDRIQEA